MDPTTLLISAGLHCASIVYKKIEDDAADALWKKIRGSILRKPDQEPDPEQVATDLVWADADPELQEAVGNFLGDSAALRRANRSIDSLRGAQILWVDDNPHFNEWETGTLEALGCQVVPVDESEAARSVLRSGEWDLVLSDIARAGDPRAGLTMLTDLRANGLDVPVVFYVGAVDPNRPVPVGARGITANPEELLHLVLDVLERSRI